MKSYGSTWGRGARFLAISSETRRKIKRTAASAFALTFAFQSFAWAVCSDGSTFPAGGYVVGQPPIVNPANFSPNIFTATAGSQFVPDTSAFEFNDPAQPPTGGGHNWVNDQGSTLCKEVDSFAPDGSVQWVIPPNTPTQCIEYPNIVNGVFVNVGSIPKITDTITPTCDPSKLSTVDPVTGLVVSNPANTYFNQLGCAISASNSGTGQPVATTPQTATTYLFGAGGQRSGSFINTLNNVSQAIVGSDAGKINGPVNWMQNVPLGQIIDLGAVSNDGKFAVYLSDRRGHNQIWACLDPLGDPGDPSQPLNPFFFVPPGNLVKCMQVGQSALAVNLAVAFGPDNQLYIGGQRIINTFNSTPGPAAPYKTGNPIIPSAWPQCIFQGTGLPTPTTYAIFQSNLQTVFNQNSQNHCGNMTANSVGTSSLITQPADIKTHKGTPYMWATALGGTVVQYKVLVNPISGITQYPNFRTYISGTSLATGLGIADDLKSIIIMTDPSSVGLAGDEVMTKLPLCEDF